MLWNEGDDLIVSIDRTDLWDLRELPEYSGPDYTHDHLAALVERGAMDEIARRFEAPYYRPAPTKLPAGRLRLRGRAQSQAELAYFTAEANAGEGQDAVHAVVEAEAEAGLLWGAGPLPEIVLEAPRFGQAPAADRAADFLSPFGPEDLDYPPPRLITEEDCSGYVQQRPDGTAFCALVNWSCQVDGWRASWTLAHGSGPGEAEASARSIVAERGRRALAELQSRHREWWAKAWGMVNLALPDAALERLWVEESYKFLAAARRNAPPVALQGPWTLDNGRLPPWKGDYHHDLNTQMTYWPALTGNRLDAHAGFLDWLWETADECRRWTRDFYDLDGLAVPMTADPYNRQIGGWAPYTHSATSGAWLAHHFVMHWRMSGDRQFLADRAYPYVRDAALFLEQLTRSGVVDGKRRLRLSSSPEIGDNRREAWFADWTNYDLVLTRELMTSAAELAAALGQDGEAAAWAAILEELPLLARCQDGGLAVAPGHEPGQSHRHFSHLLAIHPLRRIPATDKCAAASIARLEALGTDNWMGYTFAWMAGVYAAAGRGDDALRMLVKFKRGFRIPSNGFHTNGEIGDEKLTRWPFEAFTLEGNCAAMAAVQDMLLQSDEGELHLLPAIPASWSRLSFSGLRACGGVTVDLTFGPERSAVLLRAEANCELRVNLRGAPVTTVSLAAGQSSWLTLPIDPLPAEQSVVESVP